MPAILKIDMKSQLHKWGGMIWMKHGMPMQNTGTHTKRVQRARTKLAC